MPGRYAVVLAPIPNAGSTLAKRLNEATGIPAPQWRDAMVLPELPRMFCTTEGEREARDLADRIKRTGVFADVMMRDDIESACENYFAATFAERTRDGNLSFITAAGGELEVIGSRIRYAGLGKARMPGGVERFVVLGLKDEPGAVVIRSGANLDRVAPGARSELEALGALLAAVKQIAPHAKIPEKLDELAWFPGLDELGSPDMALSIVIASYLSRTMRPPEQPKAAAPREERSEPVRTGNIDDLRKPKMAPPIAVDKRQDSGFSLSQLAIPGQAPVPHAEIGANDIPIPAGQVAPSSSSSRGASGFVAKVGLIVLAVLVIGGGAFAYKKFLGPSDAVGTVRADRAWQTPWGAVFTLEGTYATKVGGIDITGFKIAVERDGQTERVQIPEHKAKEPQSTLGINWRVKSWEMSTSSPDWIEIEATRAQ